MISQLLSIHRDQFIAMGLPTHLHEFALQKIISNTFDAGAFFQFEEVSANSDDSEICEENVLAPSCDQDVIKEDSSDEGVGYALPTKYVLASVSQLKSEGAVMLIDHMWTTTFPQSRDHLTKIDGLCGRIAAMLDLESEEDSADVAEDSATRVVDRVWRAMWRHLNCYLLPVDDYTRWFLMDEVGTAITHSISPNVRCCPMLVSLPGQEPFALSLLWPLRDIQEGDLVTRDYLPNVPPLDVTRKLRLLAFSGDDSDIVTALGGTHVGIGVTSCVPIATQQTEAHELQLLWIEEGWASAVRNLADIAEDAKKTLKVFCDRSDHLCSSLMSNTLRTHGDGTHTHRIVLVDNAEEADVLYLVDHTIAAAGDAPSFSSSSSAAKIETAEDREHSKKGKITSQFCWNGMIVSKEHLVRTMRNAYGTVPFLPVTYDLSYPDQLEDFIADYATRKKRNGRQDGSGEGGMAIGAASKLIECVLEDRADVDVSSGERHSKKSNCNVVSRSRDVFTSNNGSNGDSGNVSVCARGVEDNIWIMKRYRGRQSMDYPISDSLPCLLRHLESAPRLASKYVSNPMLYKNRKFDLRYYVIVLSLKPLRIFRHKMFVVRVANEVYSHGDLELYQKHFTVMNFLDDNSNSEDDSVRSIRGTGGKENPTSAQFIGNYNAEHLMNKLTDGSGSTCPHCESETSSQPHTDGGTGIDTVTHPDSSSSNVGCSDSSPAAAEHEHRGDDEGEDSWSSDVQPGIDAALRQLFEGVALAFRDEPPHPSGSALHPNAGWSLDQPNVCTARAMYGVDVILTDDSKPLVLEVQWAPDCALAVVQNKSFWNEILGGLYLEEFEEFEEL